MDRHIKIIVTLGPATETYEAVKELVESGAKIFRLNFSHGGREFFANMVAIIRRLEEETGLTLTVLQDLSGPKIRTCDVGLGAFEVNKGTEVMLGTSEKFEGVEEPFICLDIPDMYEGVKEGDSRSEEHTSELQSLRRISSAVFCLKKKKHIKKKKQ